jgi:hypothetical protein
MVFNLILSVYNCIGSMKVNWNSVAKGQEKNLLLKQDFPQFLLSPVLTKKFSTVHKLKRYPEVSDYQKEAINGLMLSDGYARGGRLGFTFKSMDLAFIRWLKFEVLGNLSSEVHPTPYPKENPTQYWFGTRVNPYFDEIRAKWYMEKRKVLPQDFKMTPIALAFLIMGDGYWENDSNTVFISTEKFPLEEIHRLIFSLRHDLDLTVTTKKRGENYRLRFSSRGKNLTLLRKLVQPYMHADMFYKLGLESGDKKGDQKITT